MSAALSSGREHECSGSSFWLSYLAGTRAGLLFVQTAAPYLFNKFAGRYQERLRKAVFRVHIGAEWLCVVEWRFRYGGHHGDVTMRTMSGELVKAPAGERSEGTGIPAQERTKATWEEVGRRLREPLYAQPNLSELP